jgi:hypothetical protein
VAATCGPTALGRWTAEGGCPHTVLEAIGCLLDRGEGF